ncbi:hypothetical protein [Acidocella sp. KAb 2-4]|uniref:hypothetical protein n=1 Tax=Acidocella sp. KAb 2-4 TaxID=2885158 RepID=UPI001D0743E2|nr:hypothetical protein [Acidocella sp. KAb 2-4]MCB5943949.1 hypothetical protein [Acidocella sp. KAb 2-4]
MNTPLKLKKLDTKIVKVELMNALGASLGLAPCADPASLVALLDEKIDAQQEELVKLASMRETIAKMAGVRNRGLLAEDRRKKNWRPGANTVYARVRDLIQQHGILTRKEIITLLSADGGGEVPPGSISAALTKLADAEMIEHDGMGWKLCGEDTSEAK